MSTTVISSGLVFLSACTDDDDDTATEAVNAQVPTGISSRWTIHDGPFHDDSPNPSPCELEPGRRHILFSC